MQFHTQTRNSASLSKRQKEEEMTDFSIKYRCNVSRPAGPVIRTHMFLICAAFTSHLAAANTH